MYLIFHFKEGKHQMMYQVLAALYCLSCNGTPFLFLQQMTGLECGHKFCAPCWTDYLTSKIVNEGMGQTISCAAYGCDILVDDATVM